MKCVLLLLVSAFAFAFGGKLERLLKKKSSLAHGIVNLKTTSYNEYVLSTPRPYHLFVLYTATPSQYKCDVCVKVAPEFELLSASYEGSEVPVVFGVAEFEDNKEPFATHGLTSAPQLAYFPVTDKDHDFQMNEKMPLDSKLVYNFYRSGQTAEDMLPFVKKRSGVQMEIKYPLSRIVGPVLTALMVILSSMYIVYKNRHLMIGMGQSKLVWGCVSLIFYTLSVSGMVYCVIRNAPFMSRDRAGNNVYFHSQGRQQYVVEGLIIGVSNCGVGLSAVVMAEYATKIKNTKLRSIAVLVCAITIVLCYQFVVHEYANKNGWYKQFSWIA